MNHLLHVYLVFVSGVLEGSSCNCCCHLWGGVGWGAAFAHATDATLTMGWVWGGVGQWFSLAPCTLRMLRYFAKHFGGQPPARRTPSKPESSIALLDSCRPTGTLAHATYDFRKWITSNDFDVQWVEVWTQAHTWSISNYKSQIMYDILLAILL